MSLEEKAGQLSIFRSPKSSAQVNPSGRTRLYARGRDGRRAAWHGGRLFQRVRLCLQSRAAKIARSRNRACAFPLIFAADVIHGLKTTYPIPLGRGGEFRSRTLPRAPPERRRKKPARLRPALDFRARGRHRPRRALGPGDRGRRRGPVAGRADRRRPGSRLPRQGSARGKFAARLSQAFRRLWRRPGRDGI